MEKVDRLRNKVETSAALVWALGIVQYNTYMSTPDPARRPGITPPPYTQSMPFYGHSWFNSQQRRVATPPFPI